jgi:hypothetical protein
MVLAPIRSFVTPRQAESGPRGVIRAAVGLPTTVRKASFLGNFYEYAFDVSIVPVAP